MSTPPSTPNFVEQVTVSFEKATIEAAGTTTETIGDPIQIDKGLSLSAGQYPAVTAPEGYVFRGWFVGDTRIDAEGVDYPIQADATVTARIVKQTTVTYLAEGDNGNPFHTDTGDVNRAVSFPDPAPTLKGADFAGWYDETQTKKENGFLAADDMTLTAHYTVTVNFLVKDAEYVGIISTTPVVVDRNAALGGAMPGNPVMPGHDFKGWFIADAEGKPGATEVTAETGFSVHTDVVAKFTRQVTVIFDMEGVRHEFVVDDDDTVELLENAYVPQSGT